MIKNAQRTFFCGCSSIYLKLTRVVNHLQHMKSAVLDLSESSLSYFSSLFYRPEGRGSVTDRNVCEHALLGGMHGGIEGT